MLIRLSERLAISLRERNLLMLSAGYAAAYPERRLDDPGLLQTRQAVERLLAAQMPYPAIAIDRHWNLAAAAHGESRADASMRG